VWIAGVIVGLIFVSVIVGSLANFFALFLAIPLILAFIGGMIGMEQMQRQRRILQMKRFRRDARPRKVPFDAQDKRTLV
jgi:uncharacterized protein YacL